MIWIVTTEPKIPNHQVVLVMSSFACDGPCAQVRSSSGVNKRWDRWIYRNRTGNIPHFAYLCFYCCCRQVRARQRMKTKKSAEKKTDLHLSCVFFFVSSKRSWHLDHFTAFQCNFFLLRKLFSSEDIFLFSSLCQSI